MQSRKVPAYHTSGHAQQMRQSPSAPPQKESAGVPSIVHYLILVLVVATLALSVWTLMNVSSINDAALTNQIDVNDILAKLTSHEEAKAYIGIAPLNILQISRDNLASLQSQIAGLDISYIGSYLIQYADALIVYDYASDALRGKIATQQNFLTPEFLAKLYAHPEVAGLQNEEPEGGRLGAQSLATLQEKLPDVYADARVGDFLLKYSTRLVIYDYGNDRIVNVVNLQ